MPRSLLFCVALLGTFLPVAHAQDADTSLAFLLSETVSLDATYDAAARQTPTSVTVITAQEIEQFGYRTLGEALEHVRGFFVTYNQVYTHLGVRGFGDPGDLNRRVLIAIDGTSTHEFTYGSAFAERALGVPLEGLERIEVIRGPGSTRYGNGAMLIVVNLVPRLFDALVVTPIRVFFLLLLAGTAAVAAAQSTKPIRFIVPDAPTNSEPPADSSLFMADSGRSRPP